MITTDLLAHLHTTDTMYDVLCLDNGNEPGWTVTEDSDSLYSPTGLARCRSRLNSGGVLAIWSAAPSTDFAQNLRDAGFTDIRTEEVPVVRGVPDVLFLATHDLASQSA